ncbi:hypothetical protein [Ruegeria sp. HKCCA5491]|uniref:hypothetical protein n=1 Tax=Ruegeria sp. HKCCA5491 TaxID=2682986 RepID=UPI001489B9B6|nr:hypothetical protein [Ruegeria sp. HKCCA5491]
MYPLGVYLARYFDWWSDRVKGAPFWWVLGLLLGPIALTHITMALFGPLSIIFGFIIMFAAIPGLFVGYIRLGIQFINKREKVNRISNVQDGAKKLDERARNKGR